LINLPRLCVVELAEPVGSQRRELILRHLLVSVLVRLRQHQRCNHLPGPKSTTPAAISCRAAPRLPLTTRSISGSALTTAWRVRDLHFWRLGLPCRFTRLLIHRKQPRLFVRPEVQDAQIPRENRRRRVAKHVRHLSKVAVPQLLPAKVVAIKPGRPERGAHSLAIRHRRSSTIRVGLLRGFVLGVRRPRLPQELPVCPVKTHHGPPLRIADRLRHEHLVPPDA